MCHFRRLAPLSVCLPTVVAEFSRLAQRLGLMETGGLLPQRAQAMRPQRPLEMFFPFDPYLLRRSAQVRRPRCKLIADSVSKPSWSGKGDAIMASLHA